MRETRLRQTSFLLVLTQMSGFFGFYFDCFASLAVIKSLRLRGVVACMERLSHSSVELIPWIQTTSGIILGGDFG